MGAAMDAIPPQENEQHREQERKESEEPVALMQAPPAENEKTDATDQHESVSHNDRWIK
jgi:hypothetical protein